MPRSRTFHWHTAGICMVPAAVVAASLLISGVANSVPPGSAEQAVTEATAPTTPSITLATSATRVAQGTPVRLTATVNPASAGTVQFKDGADVIATPALSNGVAATTPTLTPGSHSLTATFVPEPGSTAFRTSTTESPVTVEVGATDTTTRLTTTQEGDLVGLNAIVTPANAAGTVQFRDGAALLGDPQPVVNGVATGTTSQLGTGDHLLIAEFIPTNPGDFTPSRSDASSMAMTRSGAGAVVALDRQDGVLSLDLGTSLLDDHGCVCDGRRGNLDNRQGILDDRRGLLDGRVAVLDDRPLLNVVLGVG